MNNRRLLPIVTAAAVLLIAAMVLFAPRPVPVRFSGAMKAMQLWTDQRAYPFDRLDDRLFEAAAATEKRGRALFRTAAAPAPWKQIGPHNIGGRTLAVAVNPQNPKTLYAGSAGGGLWRSRTEGKGALAWQYVPTGFPVLSVSSIAIAPNDSNLMFIGTGEVYGYRNSIGGISIRTTRGSYGIGILRTTDGGATWTKSLDWQYAELNGVMAVKMHPLHSRLVWAATSEGIYRSADTGRTWSLVHTVKMGTDLLLHPTDTSVVYAAHGNLNSAGGGIYRSTNGGASWTKLTNGLPATFGGKILLALYPPAPHVLFASVGGGATSGSWLCRSTDGGDSWTTLTTQDYASYQGWYSHFVGVDPSDSSKVIAGGVDLWKSSTGGTNLFVKSDWAAWYFGAPEPGAPEGPPEYSHADHHSITYHPTDPSIIYFGNDGGVFCSTNGGETFEGRNGGYQTTQFYNGFSSSWTDSLLAIGGMQDNATAIYKGDLGWYRVIGGDGCMTAMSPTSNDTLYGSSQSLNLLRSVNGGISWSGISVPSGGTTSFVGPFALAPSAPKVMYAGREKVFRSTTGGGGWTATNGNVVLDAGNPLIAITVAPNDAQTVYAATTPVATRAKLFRTTNSGTTWSNITGTLPNRYLIDIAVHPADRDIAYVTASGFGTSHLYRTTDGGATWSDAGAGLPDVPTSAVVIDPGLPDHLYVGNDLGVYVSTNGGGTWSSYSDGLYDATLVMDLSISPSNRAIRAVTHGNGVFERPLLDASVAVRPSPGTLPPSFQLMQNYPNPFNPLTTVGFELPERSMVRLSVFDLTGREVAVLTDGIREAGAYRVTFDGSRLASGTYVCRLQAGAYVASRKMQLVK